MPLSAIGLTLNMGYAGEPSVLNPQPITETHIVASGSANIPFGSPVIQNTDNTVKMADSTFTAANFGGIASPTTKQLNNYTVPGTIGASGGFYAAGEAASIHKEGYFVVYVGFGASSVTAGGTVYVRKAVSSSVPSSAAIGQFEATADGSTNVALTNVKFYTNHVDANGMAQVKMIYAIN